METGGEKSGVANFVLVPILIHSVSVPNKVLAQGKRPVKIAGFSFVFRHAV